MTAEDYDKSLDLMRDFVREHCRGASFAETLAGVSLFLHPRHRVLAPPLESIRVVLLQEIVGISTGGLEPRAAVQVASDCVCEV